MSNIYSEAIAEARKLKEVAEQNAKNKIIESITPRIRRLIEQELSGADDLDDIVDDIEEDLEGDLDAEPAEEDFDHSDVDDQVEPIDDIGSGIEYEEDIGMDDDLELVDDYGDMDLGEPEPNFDFDSGLELAEPMEPIELSDDIEDPIAPVDVADSPSKDKNVNINITVESRRARKTKLLRQKATTLVLKLREAKTKKRKLLILKELNKIRSMLGTKSLVERTLKKEILEVIKESTMSRRTRRNASRLNRNSRRWLFEAEEDEELDFEDEEGEEEEEEELDLEDEDEDEDEDVDIEAVKAAVEELAGELGMNVEDAEGEEGEDLEDEEDEEFEDDEELDFGDEDLDDADYGNNAKDEGRLGPPMMMGEEDDPEADDNEQIEINEASLRRALRSMQSRQRRPYRRRISETRRRRRPVSRRRRRIYEGEAKKAASSFGGGKLDKEMFVEVDEDTLLNALAEELGGAHKMQINKEKKEGGAPRMAKHFGGGSAKGEVVKEARRRANLAERRALRARRQAASAQRELKESNLFNAKLLYVNKLMQQHDLNSKQQRAIVEALDNAKTLREAKLLYTSLTDSLRRRNTRRNKSAGSLNESLVRSGSGSNSTRSSAPAKNGVELDRWAILAGIKK